MKSWEEEDKNKKRKKEKEEKEQKQGGEWRKEKGYCSQKSSDYTVSTFVKTKYKNIKHMIQLSFICFITLVWIWY